MIESIRAQLGCNWLLIDLNNSNVPSPAKTVDLVGADKTWAKETRNYHQATLNFKQ